MSETESSLRIRAGLNPRSLILGIVMVLVVVIGSPFSIFVAGSSEPTWSYFPWCVGFPFVVLVFVNALLRHFGWRDALQPAELLTVLTMGLVVSGIPIFILSWGLAIISSPYYHATPENRWVEDVHPYLPEWTLPQNEDNAIVWYFEGLPSGRSIPWDVWISPMAWWLSVILAVYFVSFCLVVIFRRQWVEHERLVFPMTEFPRRLVEISKATSVLHQKSFWVGCGAVLAIMSFNMISYFEPGFPELAFHRPTSIMLGPDFPVIYLMLHLPVLGFMFFASTTISFSIWFFYLVATLQEGIINRIGIDISTPEPFQWGLQTLTWQAWGSFTAMVLWSVWMSRRHLVEFVRHLFKCGPPLDDKNEMMSYRAAGYGLMLALAYVVWWLCRAGMDLTVALLVVFTLIVAYLGITRLVIQSGLYYLTMPITGQAFATAITGTALTPTNFGAISVSYSWFGDVQSLFMPSAAHGARLNQAYKNKRVLGLAMGIAVLIGFPACLLYLIHICYQYGASNFTQHLWNVGGIIAFRNMGFHLDNPMSTDWWRLSLFSIGAAVYSVLTLCQYRFLWWPLHPVGLAIATLWMVRYTVASVFLAWAIKSAVMHFGGVGLYRRVRPFFLGLIAGYFLGTGMSFCVDWIFFFGKGHPIYN